LQAAEKAEVTIRNSVTGAVRSPDTASSGTILIVDDSRVQRKILSAHLRRFGYRVVEAASAEEGLVACIDNAPDIIISDWMMPGMSGLEFCRVFRAQKSDRYCYFILLTSRTDKAEVARGLESGADDFLTKPVNPDELRGRLTAGERILRMERRLKESNRIATATLRELQRVYDSISRDLAEARQLQQSLLRETFHSFGNADISLILRPSGHVGGDLVGYFPINSRRIGLFALDVAGHGIASAMMTARFAAHLSGSSPEQNVALALSEFGIYEAHPPAEVVRILNRIANEQTPAERYFTFAYAEIDVLSGLARAVQAGHPHPAIQRADGRIEFVGSGGFPVGLLPNVDYEEFDVTLYPGDRFFLMSDGFLEAEDGFGNALGEEGLARMMAAHAGLRGPAFLDALVDDLSKFAGSEFADDVSGAIFEFRPAKAAAD
jgi:sigma-B regulation protein RsbU (phosphoserine phosphatase)